tara:strand:+ start:133 stop:429 length:297 start_codon:yes stop_codon:yes gene_type:complete
LPAKNVVLVVIRLLAYVRMQLCRKVALVDAVVEATKSRSTAASDRSYTILIPLQAEEVARTFPVTIAISFTFLQVSTRLVSHTYTGEVRFFGNASPCR